MLYFTDPSEILNYKIEKSAPILFPVNAEHIFRGQKYAYMQAFVHS